MHFRTHVKAEHRASRARTSTATAWSSTTCTSANCSSCSTISASPNDTIVIYSTDNGPHYNTWPDAGTTPFRSEKNSNWEGAYRVPAFVRWPGQFPAGVTLNGIVSHEDWLPTFAAVAGDADIKEQARARASSSTAASTATTSTATTMLDYLSGKAKESPRKEFIYVNDDGQIVAMRYDDWKVVFLENRGAGLRRVARAVHRAARAAAVQPAPRSRSSGPSTTPTPTTTGSSTGAFVLVPMQQLAAKFLMTMKDYPPSQTPGSFNLEKIQKQIESGVGG